MKNGDNDDRKRMSASVMAALPRPSAKQLNFLLLLIVSYGVGLCFSPKFGGNIFVESSSDSIHEVRTAAAPTTTPHGEASCEDWFRYTLPIIEDDDSFEKASSIPVVLHRNGEAEPCGEISIGGFVKEMKAIFKAEICHGQMDKYQFESLLTKSLNDILAGACHSNEEYGDRSIGFLGYCDSGDDHTPILLDHQALVPVQSKSGQSHHLPCHFHTREGLRITQSQQLSELIMSILQENESSDNENDCKGYETTQTCIASTMEKAVHLYSVPAGRVFMFAPSFVGEIFHLPHVPGAGDKPIYLEVMSLEPRVFDVFNFFNREESKDLVDRALAEKSDTHRIQRSTTGAGDKSVNSRRTSESGFDTSGKTAIKVKRRCFETLGFDEYIESHSDGLQILRYNISKAYNSHLDWIEDKSGKLTHEYESGRTGGNRFATILLYMSDLNENDGGETVFPHGEPTHVPEEDRVTKREAREQLRNSEQGKVIRAGSWEEDLVTLCRSQLAVRPHSSRAVLFYSQHPNGEVDRSSLHGACPVLSKQKYAANLWVWNTPRTGFTGAPIKKKFQEENGGPVVEKRGALVKITGSFQNSGNDVSMDNAELFYKDTLWGKFGKGDPVISVNTFEGHIWNVKVGGEIVKQWRIKAKNGEVQKFII